MSGSGSLERYATQIRVSRLGEEGQKRLGAARAVVVGVGALGSTIAHQLVRAGVGTVVLVDGDRVEIANLHRQILYTEEDAAARSLKAETAARRLAAANREVSIEAIAARLEPDNAAEILGGASIVLDGTDTMRTRFLLNARCVEAGTPWVYGGVAATHGLVMPVVPGQTACLRCLFEDPPAEEASTGGTVGVFGPAPAVVGALEAAAAMRIIVGSFEPPTRLTSVDVWTGECDSIVIERSPTCPACGRST